MNDNLPVQWADKAMFEQDETFELNEDGGVMPKVTLLWMTPRPLSAIAAMSEMYKGNVVRDLDDITDEMKASALADVQKTHLKAPLEAVKLHFMIEGVDRAFTHQLVRQRTAVYAQESMRFAVVSELHKSCTLPPSLDGTGYSREMTPNEIKFADKPQQLRRIWDDALYNLEEAYDKLVDAGMPQEDARGLLPHAVATRLNYITDLRNLSDHAGNRLCTQAQFVWREVFTQIQAAIANYTWHQVEVTDLGDPVRSYVEGSTSIGGNECRDLANANLFRPVCYQLGHCPFKASFDRACKIRDRVEALGKHGVPSEYWENPPVSLGLPGIKDEEWRLNPAAARVPS